MKKIIPLIVFFVLFSLVIIAECPEELPEDISSEDSFSKECLNGISLEELGKMSPEKLEQLKSRWNQLSVEQISHLYSKKLQYFQDKFSEENNVQLSGCKDKCRFENGNLYNPLPDEGVKILGIYGKDITALPDGGFEIQGKGSMDVFGREINCGEDVCSAQILYTPINALSDLQNVKIDVNLPEGQTAAIDNVEYTGKEPSGSDLTIYPAHIAFSGSTAFLHGDYSGTVIGDGTFSNEPSKDLFDFSDLSLKFGPVTIDEKYITSSYLKNVKFGHPEIDKDSYKVEVYYDDNKKFTIKGKDGEISIKFRVKW